MVQLLPLVALPIQAALLVAESRLGQLNLVQRRSSASRLRGGWGVFDTFIIEELTDLVEEAVLLEFDRITERGGVLGAMETMYQRSKIQEESMYYETLRHNGEFPIIGVNTFLSSKGSPTVQPEEVIRATEKEKQFQIETKEKLNKANLKNVEQQIVILQEAAIQNENLFDKLMEATKVCSLGQITEALFKVGGQYRRNM